MRDWWDELSSNPVNFKESKGSVERFKILLPDRLDNLVEVSISYYLNGGIVYNIKFEPDDPWFDDDVNYYISQVLLK